MDDSSASQPGTSRRHAHAGFTLIELLIVIAVLGILSVVVVFAVGGLRDSGQENACSADRETVEVAVEAYRAEVGGDPDEAQLVPDFLTDDSDYHDVADGVITPVGACVTSTT
jgi:prepilin-type N-terminal cleavage/methylation domain-containing protein